MRLLKLSALITVIYLAASALLPALAKRIIGDSLLINKSGYSRLVYDKSDQLLKVSLSSDDKLRIYAGLEKIDNQLIEAFLTQEDQYFYWHPGVNPASIARAFISNLFTDSNLGASTISMQLARLRFGINSKNFYGKLKQISYAAFTELLYTKKQILEAYLNKAPFGGNIEGVEAASFAYFNKKSSELNCSESVILAVIPQNPNKRYPYGSPNISAALKLVKKINSVRPDFCPEFTDLLKEAELKRFKAPFKAQHFTQKMLNMFPDQPEIHSSLDNELQELITRISRAFINGKDRLGINNASVLLVENSTLQVRSYLGSADFWSAPILGQNDGLNAKRSPGSALKPFLYALAIDRGIIHPHSLLKDTEYSKSSYNPENFEKDFIGPIDATDALIRSRNIPAVSLLNSLGLQNFYSFLQTAQIKKMRSADFYGLSLVLGGVEVTALELGKLYATLANNGEWSELNFLRIPQKTAREKLFSPEAAFLTAEMLKENPRPEASLDSLQTVRTQQVAWKTGTSFGFRDAWAAGIIGDYTLVVWLGNFDGSGNPAFIGRDVAGILFFKIADALSSRTHTDKIHKAVSNQLNLKKVRICSVSGELPGPDCLKLKDSWFIPGVSPIKTCSLHRSVNINPVSGLRTCQTTTQLKKVYEFWPSDLAELFRKAGLPRAEPPAFETDCHPDSFKAAAPLISSPQASLTYHLQTDNELIPLSAVIDADSPKSFWFADDLLIAEARAGETVFWKPKPGNYLIRVVDSAGRSNQVDVKVRMASTLN